MNAHTEVFYRVNVLAYPAEAMIWEDVHHLSPDDLSEFGIETDEGLKEAEGARFAIAFDPNWKPEGWLADPEARKAWVERHGDAGFFWPAEHKLYGSLRSAKDRVKLFERYGARAEVQQSDPINWPSADELRERKITHLEWEISKLRTESEA